MKDLLQRTVIRALEHREGYLSDCSELLDELASEVKRLQTESDALYRAVWGLFENEKIEASLNETTAEIRRLNLVAGQTGALK